MIIGGIIESITPYQVVIDFVAHFTIFFGTFYVAVHNRSLPQWHIVPLWYTGLFALLGAITILVQWTIGPEHPLSYWNLGRFVETLLNVSVASIAIIMFSGTLLKDLKGSKNRKRAD